MTPLQWAAEALQKILAALLTERDELDAQIESLTAAVKSLEGTIKRNPGRPKGSRKVAAAMQEAGSNDSPTTPKKGRRKWTAAQKKKQAEAMRAAWAKRKAAKGRTAKSEGSAGNAQGSGKSKSRRVILRKAGKK